MMNKIAIPALVSVALFVLFLLMPETPNYFDIFECKSCVVSEPYLPLMGVGYFSGLFALSLLFPNFPSPLAAKCGVVWSILLAGILTFLNLPQICVLCLVAHMCHVLMWILWNLQTPNLRIDPMPQEKFCLAILFPVGFIALYSALNLTFMTYNVKVKTPSTSIGMRIGDAAPAFLATTTAGESVSQHDAEQGELVINFVLPDCPYCKQQLPIIDAIAKELENKNHRFINISPHLSSDFTQLSSATEWVEDKDDNFRKLFHVTGYPTIVVISREGKIKQVISGLPLKLKKYLLASLSQKD